MQSYVLLAISRGGWGEAAFALHLARQLQARGDRPQLITHANSSGLMRGTGVPYTEIGDHVGSLVWPLITETVKEATPEALVLCDFFTTDSVLARFGVDGQQLRDLGPPLVAVDTWANSVRCADVDVFWDKRMTMRNWIRNVATIRPCPILPPEDQAGVCSFAAAPAKISKKVRAHVRAGLGLKAGDRAILFCTAKWQQSAYLDEDGDRCAASFASLLATYIGALPDNVIFVHVGPTASEALGALGSRYRWVPPLGSKFDLVFGACDLFLTANFSATTVSKALTSQIPVLMLQNSCRARTCSDALAWLETRATPNVVRWLEGAVPIFPFRLWPLGFFDFLSPLSNGNPYWIAMRHAEWLDELAVLRELSSLLFSEIDRCQVLVAQEAFVEGVASLPSAAAALDEAVEVQRCAV